MKNKMFLVFFIVLIVMSCINVFANADLNASYISFTSEGRTVTSIPSLKELKAKVILTNKTQESQKAFFSLLLFKDNKLIDLNIDCKDCPAGDTNFEATLIMPEIADGSTEYKVNAVLWSDFDEMKALCSYSLFPTGNNKIKRILLDGNPISGFESDKTEYRLESFDVSRVKKPIIEAFSVDGGTKIDVINPTYFPGKGKISATATDGTNKMINIYYSCNSSFVTNLQFLGAHNSPIDNPKIQKSLQIGDYFYADRTNMTIIGIDESIVGLPYITTLLNWNNASNDSLLTNDWKSQYVPADSPLNTAKEWVTFDLTRTADVMILSEKALKYLDANTGLFTGWTRTNKTSGYYTRREASGTNYDTIYMYKKRFDVEQGSTAKVSLPNAGVGLNPYIVVIGIVYNE